MSPKAIRIVIRTLALSLCLAVSACGDFSGQSSLRSYDSSVRVEKINKELASLEKNEGDKAALERMGDLHEQLVTIYLEKENLDTALTHMNKAFGYGRNNPYLNYTGGLIYGNRGAKSGSKEDIARAEKYYRKAVELKDSYDEAWYGLAVLLFLYKNERDEPIKILEGLYSRKRSFYRARFALGRFYYEAGRTEDALKTYETLQGDLEKLPGSEIIMEYKRNCAENIARIRGEMKTAR